MITLFSILRLGFILGMRHATDPDHVVAVSTTRSNLLHRWISLATGALSICFGGFLVYQLGFVHGLFSH